MWLFGVPALITGCALDNAPKTGEASDRPLVLTADMKVSTEGILDFGTVVFAQNPTTLLEAKDFHGYEFDGKAGGIVTITMSSSSCGLPDTVLDLFGPENISGDRGTSLIENDDANLAPCDFDARISNFRLPVDGTYLIVGTSFLQQGGGANGHYRLTLTCNNGACALPGSPTFASTRIAQTAIDSGAFTPAALFDIGDFLFETVYRFEDGMGNALVSAPANSMPRPNFRPFPNNVHFAAFGAPEAQSCVTCHNVGGDGGAGDLNHNIFQIGDGINRASGVPRNPPPLLGNGLRQRLGEEMTADLQGQLAAARAQVLATNVAVTKALTSKCSSFGSLIVNPNGTINTAGVVGVDSDLIVKPFGWKGREATLRRFIEGSFRVHFGMQTQPSVNEHCSAPQVNTFGNGANCQDPDGDGRTNEITDGQLTAEAVYMGLREAPNAPSCPATQTSTASDGKTLFNLIGCTSCHRRSMTINVPVHIERPDTTGGAGIALHLATDTKDPHPALNDDGSMTVELWSDFKRHDMGAVLADSKNFNQIAANQFITPPLWGVAASAPYLHDGRAPTLNDAILAHAGDAQAVRNAYAALSVDQQSQILDFLSILGGAENVTSPTTTAPQVSPTLLDLATTDNCPRDVCGLNGLWLGGGVPFRTLRLDGTPNDQGFRIVDFRIRDPLTGKEIALTADVNNDSLIGRQATGQDLSGHQLKGAYLTLKGISGPAACPDIDTITVTIKDVTYRPFLAECTPPYQCDSRQVPIYTFTATNGDGCPLEVCRPGLNPDDSSHPNLSGDAVIFQGDTYDERTFQVTETPTSNNLHGIINIACLGSATSKLHLLRHTSASQSAGVPSSTPLQRQSLLRLLTGDYCGSGDLFTQNGIPIHLGFNNSPYQPTADSKFQIATTDIVDARWNDTGATCIGAPRLGVGILDQIKNACKTLGHSLPDCATFAAGSDATSATPKIIITRATD
jgi:cytochrome c peroxidase